MSGGEGSSGTGGGGGEVASLNLDPGLPAEASPEPADAVSMAVDHRSGEVSGLFFRFLERKRDAIFFPPHDHVLILKTWRQLLCPYL